MNSRFNEGIRAAQPPDRHYSISIDKDHANDGDGTAVVSAYGSWEMVGE